MTPKLRRQNFCKFGRRSKRMLYLRTMELTIKSLEHIAAAAESFIEAVELRSNPAQVFAFYGKMGAGKTTFVKAICEALGVDDVVNSPTFAIVNEYDSAQLGCPIFHFDFYRIKALDEAYAIGTDDYFYSGRPCFIEWPELIEPLLPEHARRVEISENPDGTRRVVVA